MSCSRGQLVVLALAAGGGLLLGGYAAWSAATGAGSESTPPPRPASTAPSSTPVGAPAASPTPPAAASASPAASPDGTTAAPEKKWTPPRFIARQRERDAMVRVIRDEYGLEDKAVLAAMAAVPRHEFVPADLQSSAHADTPLPIGHGQTISQPYMVAEMTRQLNLKPDSRVLEVGTGSGYQAAILTEFTTHVYTIEIVRPLAETARDRLKRLGYDPVVVRAGDGYYGWREKAPFDAIIVTCAAGQIPPPLVEQLAPGGRMVIPVGGVFFTQSLMLVEKDKDGTVRSRSLMPVRFVPLIREDPSLR